MQSIQVKAFKNELRNYNYYLQRETSLVNSVEFLYDRLGGVRGVDPSKEPIHAMPNKEMEWKLRDDISKLEAKLSLLRAKIAYIDQILNRMEKEQRQAVKAVFCDSHRMEDECKKYHYSPQGFNHYINKAIEGALDEKI